MSDSLYDDHWRKAFSSLTGSLEAECPSQASGTGAPAALEDWARVYVGYLQAVRHAAEALRGEVHPQRRLAVRGMLEAALGRALQLRAWLAELNGGVDIVDLEPLLAGMGLEPSALELPAPAHALGGRGAELAARGATLAQLAPADARPLGSRCEAPGDPAAAAEAGEEGALTWSSAAVTASLYSDSQRAMTASTGAAPAEPEPEPEQGARKGAGAPAAGRAAALPEGRDRAALRIQAAVRGWLARRRVARRRREEHAFLGMAPPPATGAASCRREDARRGAAAVMAGRREQQAQRAAEYEAGLEAARQALRQREGPAMRQAADERLHAWFAAGRDPVTGDYPDLPLADQGGSKALPEPAQQAAAGVGPAAARRAAGAPGRAASAAGARPATAQRGSSGTKGKGPAASAATRPAPLFLEEVRQAVQQYRETWQHHHAKPTNGASVPAEVADLPQPRLAAGGEAFDPELARAAMRAAVEEEARLEADAAMRGVISRVKAAQAAERAALQKKAGKKGKGEEEPGTSQGPAGARPKTGGAAKGAAAAGPGQAKAPAPRPKKDLTAGRSTESIFAELAACGLACACPDASLSDYLGGCLLARPEAEEAAPAGAGKVRNGGKAANGVKKSAGAAAAPSGKAGAGARRGNDGTLVDFPEASMAQARQAVAAACLLPLAVPSLAPRLGSPPTALLYGPPGTGKTLLTRAIACQAGAALFDLSPSTTRGKYPGKEAALMVHMVFKAARAMAPSVVYIDDCEEVFITDKTRAAELAAGGEPPSRIRRHLLAEVASLRPEDRVLVLGNSRRPQSCVKRDERDLIATFATRLRLPLPDHASRRVFAGRELLAEFGRRQGLGAPSWPALSRLSLVAEGLSAGQLEGAVGTVATALRGRGGAQPPPGEEVERELLRVLPALYPLDEEERAALLEWTIRAHSPLPPEAEGGDAPKGKGKGR